MYQSCAENKLSEREGGETEREAYKEEKKIRKKCTRFFFFFFFCGNECERSLICNYPGAKKKRLFETEHCVIVY